MKEMLHFFEKNGFKVESGWIRRGKSDDPSSQASSDLKDVDRSDVLIQFTDGCKFVPGGMHVELGYALAKGKLCTVCGEKTNVFHNYLDVKCFETKEQVLEYLEGLEKK